MAAQSGEQRRPAIGAVGRSRPAALLAAIDRDLPALARELIPRSPSATPAFLADPDHPDQHKPEWHEFGIITHTRRFVVALRTAVPQALRDLDAAVARRVEAYLDVPLGDLSRRDLMLVAGYWHDIGKFSTRTLGRRGDWRFGSHAHESARLIAGRRPDHRDGIGACYGLAPAQIAFVARLADLHYAPMELKLALDRRPDAPHGDAVYDEIADRLGDEGYAVCCHFWADCLSKGETPRQREQWPALWALLDRTLHAVDRRLGQQPETPDGGQAPGPRQ